MRKKNSSEHRRIVYFGGIEQKVCMAKIRNFAEIAPNLPFTEYNFYEEYRGAFEKAELGWMKKILPLHEMAKSLGLVSESLRPKRGRRSYFTPEGKVALMFQKMKTQMSFPKLMEALNGNIFYQMFCDIVIDPAHPLTNYKLLDDIPYYKQGKTLMFKKSEIDKWLLRTRVKDNTELMEEAQRYCATHPLGGRRR